MEFFTGFALLLLLLGIAFWRLVRQRRECRFQSKIINEQAMQFKLALESSPCGMLMVGQDGVISRVNTRIEQMFGYTGEELLGKPVEFLIPALHQVARTGCVSAPAVRPMGAGRELSGLHKDGSECPVEIGLNPLSMASGTSVLATVIDITDRKKAEASLRHAAKMTAISTLSGGMAHEFNNRLTAVLGFSHLALPLIPNGNKCYPPGWSCVSWSISC